MLKVLLNKCSSYILQKFQIVFPLKLLTNHLYESPPHLFNKYKHLTTCSQPIDAVVENENRRECETRWKVRDVCDLSPSRYFIDWLSQVVQLFTRLTGRGNGTVVVERRETPYPQQKVPILKKKETNPDKNRLDFKRESELMIETKPIMKSDVLSSRLLNVFVMFNYDLQCWWWPCSCARVKFKGRPEGSAWIGQEGKCSLKRSNRTGEGGCFIN